jgi:hypothetical protein
MSQKGFPSTNILATKVESYEMFTICRESWQTGLDVAKVLSLKSKTPSGERLSKQVWQ